MVVFDQQNLPRNIAYSKVYIDQSKYGRGVFAKRNIEKGKHIFRFTGQPISFEASVALGQDECYSVQTGEREYMQPDAPGMYVNHSCEPNCGLNGLLILIALQNISQGQELFFDYSTTMLERHWEMDCNCGTAGCRHTIRDFDLLPENLRLHYRNLGIVQPFILELLDRKNTG